MVIIIMVMMMMMVMMIDRYLYMHDYMHLCICVIDCCSRAEFVILSVYKNDYIVCMYVCIVCIRILHK